MSDAPLIVLSGVTKLYRKAGITVRALDGVDITLSERGLAALVGPSGSGKSSLLHIVGAMDRPTEGSVVVATQDLRALPERELTTFRRRTIGFVFQSFNLIPNLSALENVTLPMEFDGQARDARERRARDLLGRVGLTARASHRPYELSGGEQQRVAIARALANDPPVVLADEPTGNLDTKTGQAIIDLLRDIAQEKTVLVVTHAEGLAATADRVLRIRDGRIDGAA